VGLVGLEALFEEFAAAGREPSPDLGVELVRRVAQRNYVPPAAAGEYARALVAEYRRYLGEAVPEERVGISIRILGPGCPQCEHLTSNVVSALAALDVAADVEHVTDPRAIAEYGVLGTPALVINGTVKVVGRVPTVAEIKAWLAR
jgi:small redox-active disulfide protein 2